MTHRTIAAVIVTLLFVCSAQPARAMYNSNTGRFWSMDSYEGNGEDPLTLHKYLYVHANPVNGIDPSGNIVSNLWYGIEVHRLIGADFRARTGGYDDQEINAILGTSLPWWLGGKLRPDLANAYATYGVVYEIKPIGLFTAGQAQLTTYLGVLNMFDPSRRAWIRGSTFIPERFIPLAAGVVAIVAPPRGGVILYEVVDYKEYLAVMMIYAARQVIAAQLAKTVEILADFGRGGLQGLLAPI